MAPLALLALVLGSALVPAAAVTSYELCDISSETRAEWAHTAREHLSAAGYEVRVVP